MATIFTKIINGEIPGRFVWKDDQCAAFMTINPIRSGHVLVVPRREVDHWLDLEPDLLNHLMAVSQQIGRALQAAYQPTKVGMMLAGLEVPHAHIHLIPIWELKDLDFTQADPNPAPEALDAAADTIRDKLRAMGCEHVCD